MGGPESSNRRPRFPADSPDPLLIPAWCRYSWVLNSLVGAVYTFGFILMCPQLYLNYKLKSVAHLPW